MISPEQIEQWIHEVEQRPSSAPIIIQYIGKRLAGLAQRNEDLLAENIELRSGRRVDEYEKRVAGLEYQLGLLKRQLGGITPESLKIAQQENMSLLIFTPAGKVLRTEIITGKLSTGNPFGGLGKEPEISLNYPRLLAVNPSEELLFVFNSGRTETFPVNDFAVQDIDSLIWNSAKLIEPRGGEELAAILPIAQMTLKDYCVQISRKGCLKKMMMNSFESHISKNFIGTGIKQKPDRTFTLLLANKDEPLVITSREGFVLRLSTEQLSYTSEEVLRLGPMDYLVSASGMSGKNSIVVITENGKAVQREINWLESADSFRSKGQPVFSQSRRDSGVRSVGAAAVNGDEWGVALLSNGKIIIQKISDIFSSGKITNVEEPISVVDFTAVNL